MSWTVGDISGSETLTSDDHIYAVHINELRTKFGEKEYNVKDYGVVGDGVTDDTTAIQTVLDLGGRIYFPAGTYLVSTQIRYASNSFIYGAGRGKTIIKLKDSSNLNQHGVIEPANFVLGNPIVENVTIAHLTVDGNMDNNTGTLDGVFFQYTKNGLLFDVEAINCEEAGIVAGGYWEGAIGALDYTKYAGVIIQNCFMHDNYEGFQGANCIISNCVAQDNTTSGFHTANSGVRDEDVPTFTIYSNCVSSNNETGYTMDYQAANYMRPIYINNCTAIKNQYGYSGNLGNVFINGGTWEYNTAIGIALGSMYGPDVVNRSGHILGAIIKNNTGVGINLDRGQIGLLIAHNKIFDDQTVATQTYGITYTNYMAGTQNKIIDNDFYGNGTAIHEDFYTHATLLDYEIRGNTGVNPIGYATINVTASPFTYSAHAAPETVYINGGTVSDITKGTTLFTSTGKSVCLEPHGTVKVTYSAAPTMVKYRF